MTPTPSQFVDRRGKADFTPKVSVVIPLYNKSNTILRAMNSVLTQTRGDFEIIVVDDGSTDDSADKVSGISDPRIRLVRQANQGPAAARNRGLAESRAEWVAFLDADDEYLPNYLETCLAAFEHDENCALVACGYRLGESTQQRSVRIDVSNLEGAWRLPPDASPELLRKVTDGIICMSVVRRQTALDLGGFYEKDRCSYGEDTYLWLLFVLNHTICYIPDPLCHYHNEDSGLSGFSGRLPIPKPALTDPSRLFEHCPTEYRPLLERYLDAMSRRAARYRAWLGMPVEAFRIARRLPAHCKGGQGMPHAIAIAVVGVLAGIARRGRDVLRSARRQEKTTGQQTGRDAGQRLRETNQ